MATKSKRSYCWAFTLNNPTLEETVALDAYPCKYMAYGREHWDTPGLTRHFQGMFQLTEGKTQSALVKDCTALISSRGAVILSVVKCLDSAIDYCFKGDQSSEEFKEFHTSGPNFGLNAVVVERGIRPVTDRKEEAKARAKRNLDALLENRHEDVDIDIVATQLRNYEYGANWLKQKRAKVEHLHQDPTEFCEFHYGVSRAGKSAYTETLPSKPFLWNKDTQWNMYNFEEIVIFTDIDEDSAPSVNQLKTWCDPAPFLANIKFGTMHIRPTRMIVTTNEKSFADMFPRKKPHIVQPIEERFTVFEWKHKYFIDGKPKLGPNPDWAPPSGLISETDTPGPQWTEDPMYDL